jgi:oligoribonuclease NrnB/cAMP/cGMP phosphodiesterase (DHH superfamily)
MREKVLCIYHNADLDGICSAAIVYDYFNCQGDVIDGNVILYGMNYGDDFPWSFIDKDEMTKEDKEDCVPYDKVVMVDFSLSKEDMKRLNNLVDLIWIDHHVSVIADNKDIQGVRDINYAACELTYMYFHTGIIYIDGVLALPLDGDMPKAVRLIGRYDVWDHSDKETVPFQYGMKLYNLGPANSDWLELLGNSKKVDKIINQIIRNGHIIDQYKTSMDLEYTNRYGFHAKLEFDNKYYKVLCLNRGMTNFGSVVFSSLYDPSIDLVMCFIQSGEGYRVSLYTERNIDVSVIAKSFGGGGHKKASGFLCSDLLFDRFGNDTVIDIFFDE